MIVIFSNNQTVNYVRYNGTISYTCSRSTLPQRLIIHVYRFLTSRVSQIKLVDRDKNINYVTDKIVKCTFFKYTIY